MLLLGVSAVAYSQKGTTMDLWPKGAPNSNGDNKDKAELTVQQSGYRPHRLEIQHASW